MSAFIEQAKEVLNNEQVTRLELLARKAADFETTTEEDNELFELKKEVKKLIADRDRNKNLAFLKDGAYSVKEVLASMGADHQAVIKDSGLSINDIFKLMAITKKQAMQAVREVYTAGGNKEGDSVTVIATYGSDDITMGRNSRELNAKVLSGKEKTLIANLTDTGRTWIMENYVSDKGPYKGQTIYPNINAVAQKFKFNKDELKKELGLIKEEKKAETKAPAKKAEDKKAA